MSASLPQGGTLVLQLPNEAAQLIASVPSEAIWLTLVPEDYEAEVLPQMTEQLLDGPTPAEVESCLTPYGPGGFIEGDLSTVAGDSEGGVAHFSCAAIRGG